MTASTFDDIIEHVLNAEGGYVNDPDDAGGETNFGISKRAHPDVDIAGLTVEEAKKIYRQHYWKPSRAGELPPGAVRHHYFDMVVNHGRQGAVRILQRACRRSVSAFLTVDGIIGPKTIAAAGKMAEEGLADMLVLERALYFNAIVARGRSQERFLHGWLNRAFTFITNI